MSASDSTVLRPTMLPVHVLLVLLLCICCTSAMVCNVADHGAIGDNATVNTASFRAAAAACADRGVPGARSVLLVPAGVFLTGAFNLSSHMELRLERGATIAAVLSVSKFEYPEIAVFPSYGACRETGDGIQPPRGYKSRSQASAWTSAFTTNLQDYP